MIFCLNEIKSRSKYSNHIKNRCHLPAGHPGKCSEFPFLTDLSKKADKVAKKIKRDATMTTGASWKSDEAGPNRILRYVAMLSDHDLKELFDIDFATLPEITKAKVREKAASYDDCLDVAMKLTWLAYQMEGAPEAGEQTGIYLQDLFGTFTNGSTVCEICKSPIPFALFHDNRRGKAAVETAHKNPRVHTAENVGFAHRYCNVAQGDKPLGEFYQWMRDVLARI